MDSQRPVVLVVSDLEEWREPLRWDLETAGFEVATALTANEARHVLADRRVDAAVVELTIPNRDGFAALRAVRASGSRIPTVVTAAHAEECDWAEARAIGADDGFMVPYEEAQVAGEVIRLLAERSPRD
jgi:DNA-binding response OmpR family regulator